MNQQLAIHSSDLPAEDFSLPAPNLGHNVDNLWRILWRRKWRCLSAFALIGVAGTATLLTLPPQYTAHTIMVAESRQPDLAATDQVSAVVRQKGAQEADIESEIQLMMSGRALLKVARDVGLDQDESFQESARHASKLTLLRYYWINLVRGDWTALAEGLPASKSEGAAIDAALIEVLNKKLKIDQLTRSTTVDISFTWTDPVIAAKFANGVASTYIANRDALRREDAERATRYLRTRSSELLQEVTAAEQAVENFRQSSILRDGRDIDQLRSEMERTNAQLAQARIARDIAITKLAAVEARVRQVGIIGAIESGESKLNDALREMEAQTRSRLAGNSVERGSAHPETRRAQQEYAATRAEVVFEAEARLSRFRADVAVADQQLRLLEHSLKAFRKDYEHLSTALLTLRGFERQASASRTVYEAFLNRIKVTEQVGFNEAESWIMSSATPPASPSSPNPVIFLGATLFLATGVALSLALLAEHKAGQTILSSQHILDRGLRPLGIVPDVGRRTGTIAEALQKSVRHEQSAFSESVGAIFTSLMELKRREQSSLVLLITSALPFEGKSTTIMALAAKMASAGKRVLLIDADLRAPRLHRAFGITSGRGLTDCLDPARNVADSIFTDPQTGIAALFAGPASPEPQNVLRSEQLFEAIEDLRRHYDFVLIDTPPVLPFSDARILLPLADYSIFVMRWGRTRWSSAMHALRLLRDSGARLAGVVVSQVDVKKLAAYQFADSEVYGRAYRRYAASK
jgi:capsular exopolysaccharide synthesis family protein